MGLQAAIRGHHDALDRRPSARHDPRAIRRGNGIGKARERRIERAFLGVRDDLQSQLRHHTLHDHPWLRALLAGGELQQFDVLVDQRTDGLETQVPVVIVFKRLKGEQLGHL